MRKRLLAAALIAAALVLVSAGWYLLQRDNSGNVDHAANIPGLAGEQDSESRSGSASKRSEANSTRPPNRQAFVTGISPERPAIHPLPPAPLSHPDDRSPLADDLRREGNTGVDDLRIVFSLFEHYRERFGGIPTGEDNASIVNALTGNNPKRIAFISRDHPAINAHGELTDRWGLPLFFHIQSSEALEIRSAGPDMEMYTPDDLLHQSPSLRRPSP